MENNILTRQTLLQAQVCSSEDWDSALDWIRTNHPAGTSNNWQKDERPEVKPVNCEEYPDRKHYIFVC